jgi:hypothetical protein
MRGFFCFSYTQGRSAAGSPGPARAATGLAPGDAGGRDLGETASVSGQLSVLLARPVVRAAVLATFTG